MRHKEAQTFVLCFDLTYFAVISSRQFNNTGYRTVAFRLCETVWSGIFSLEVTIRVTKDGRSVHWRTEEGRVGAFKPPPPEILKTFQNRGKLNPIVKTVKNC